MRQKIVFVLLVGMLGGATALLATRPRASRQTPAAPVQTAALPSASAVPNPSSSAAAPNPSAVAAAAPSASAATAAAVPAPAMDRPLSVIGLGWESITPAVLANEGVKANEKSVFAASKLDVRLSAAQTMSAVEESLARGGSDANGADVAVVPFASFVEAYERLRALSPEVFFVVGFSRGREALATTAKGLPTEPPKGDVKILATKGTPATFLGLFMLDFAGVPMANVQVLAPGSRDEKDATFFAFERNEESDTKRKIVLTTADTPHLVPIVAIAPHGLLTEKERAMTALARGWLDGVKKLASDPPAGARQISTISGAPEPLTLLRRLGEMEMASLGDNAQLLGLSGRTALTLPTLFARTWQLYRGVSFVSTPPPESLPISTSVVTSLVRSSDLSSSRDNRPSKGDFKEGKSSIVAYHQDKLDEDALVHSIGLLAATFERSMLKIAVGTTAGSVDTAKTKKIIDAAEGQFAIEPGRLVVASKSKTRGAVVEVMALP